MRLTRSWLFPPVRLLYITPAAEEMARHLLLLRRTHVALQPLPAASAESEARRRSHARAGQTLTVRRTAMAKLEKEKAAQQEKKDAEGFAQSPFRIKVLIMSKLDETE